MPEGELSLVKNIMVGEMMRILDGPFGIADVTIENILCGRDHTVINENIRRIQAMTPADVQQLARKYLSREELVTVIAGDPAKIDACALRLRSNTPPAERHEKSTGIPVLFHFRIRYTLSALPARHPTARTRTQTAVSDVHDPPRLFPVGRDPVGQLHEIGDRELLGALRKKGMFCAAEIAEYRPQRVADHLAALAE